MTRQMKTLMVTKFLPLPADNGGKIRSLAVAKQLVALGEVTLCAFDDGNADVAGLESLGIEVRSVPWPPGLARSVVGMVRTGSLSAGRFFHPDLARHVRAAAKGGLLDLLQVEYSTLTPYARGIPARRRVLDLHNVESALARSYARSKTGWKRIAEVEARALERMERRARGQFDAFLTVSRTDRDTLMRQVWNSGAGVEDPYVVVCPNGWDPCPSLPASSDPVAVFVALMGWAPNADAACWMAHEIWPLVRAHVPDARLLLVGRDPTPTVRSLADARNSIEVTGAVETVTPYLASAQVALAPLRSGGGSRLKILEALNAGRPVVATSTGAEGLEDLVGNGIIAADKPEDFASAIVDLLVNPAAARKLGARGHDMVEQRYAWPIVLQPLVEFAERAMRQAAP